MNKKTIFKKINLNNKAQSSIMDALYFITIISVLSGLMFFFTSNYGTSIENRLNENYQQQYADSALKTLLFISTPRNLNETLYTTSEVDYLFTMIKEDFADDFSLNETNEILAKNIIQTMKPIDAVYDYAFILISSQNVPQVEYFFLSIKNYEKNPVEQEHYFCNFKNASKMDQVFYSQLNEVIESSQSITLITSESGAFTQSEITLMMWVSSPMSYLFLDSSNLNCELINFS